MFFVRQAQEHEVQDVEQNTEAAASKQEQFSTVDENSLAGDQVACLSQQRSPALFVLQPSHCSGWLAG